MRAAGLAVTLTAAALLHGCGGTLCTEIGAYDTVTLRIDADLASRARSIDVRVCQDGDCRRTRVPELKGYVPGRTLSLGVGLPGRGIAWEPGDATALIQPRDSAGAVIRDYRIAFTLKEYAPNGYGCDPTVVRGRLRIS